MAYFIITMRYKSSLNLWRLYAIHSSGYTPYADWHLINVIIRVRYTHNYGCEMRYFYSTIIHNNP